MYVCIYVCMYACKYVYVHMYECVHVHIYEDMYVCMMYVHTYLLYVCIIKQSDMYSYLNHHSG